jgi:putative ABC transport system permease protein
VSGGLGAVFRAAAGGLSGRKLQAVIIGMVVLTATAASTLALGMLANAHSPFDHAFAQHNGAHVVATVDTSIASAAQIAAAAKVTGATAVAGPLEAETAAAKVAIPGVSGSVTSQLTFVGRSAPSAPVDDLTVHWGHWAISDGQVVVSDTGNAPPQLGATITVGSQALTVVGIADSVTNTADAWVLPAAMAAIAGSGGTEPSGTGAAATGTGQVQLLYRFSSSATASDINADINEIRAALPSGALQNAVSYLNVRQAEQSSVAPWTPFIIAFGVIALVISVLIVVNVVGGAVVAGTTRIGVLKSIGFTPVQVVGAYLLLVAVPGVTGALVGVACGNLVAAPFYLQNAQLYKVGALGVPFWVDLAVPAVILLLTGAAAFGPSLRAGRMSPVQAIATGRAPKPKHGFFAQRALARLTGMPRPVTLGLASPAARPGRTLVTLAAVLFGAVAVTFGVGLSISLSRAFSELSTGSNLPVTVAALTPGYAVGNSGGPAHFSKEGSTISRVGDGVLSMAQQRTVTTAIGKQPGTRHYLSVFEDSLSLPGLSGSAGGVQVTAYGHGDPSWSGLALIKGSWYSSSPSAREADVNTLFLTDTGTSVGGTYTIVNGSHRVTVRIVGEVFEPGNSVGMLTSPATLSAVDPSAGGVRHYAIAVRPGVSPQAYANHLQAALGGSYGIGAGGPAAKETLALTTLVAMLTLLIIVVAGLGVLNTVALQIRERAHDIGIFKALGMTPRQALTLVVCSVGITGLVPGVIAVPAGIALHHGVIPAMVHAANSGYPPNLMSVYSLPEMVLLALAGLAIAIAGALAPASWAARTSTATALRTE